MYYNNQGEEVPAPKKVKPRAAALDPRLTAMARALRGRWAEESKQVGSAAAKHDVRRVEGDAPGQLTAEFAESRKLLAKAA